MVGGGAAMAMETSSGKRTAHLKVQIVEDGDTIEMWVREAGRNPIVFEKETGRSGPHAYGKLLKVLDEDGVKES
jgi:hypothetical protein